MNIDLSGRSVIISGGGTGIGAACARAAAQTGAAVTIFGRTESTLEATAKVINSEPGIAGHVEWHVGDVTDEADVRRLFETVTIGGGRVGGLVANAGGGTGLLPMHLQDVDDYQRVLKLNVVGALLMLKHGLPSLVAGGGGSFVAISSLAGHVTHPYFGAYPVSKAALEELVRNAADEYGPAKVRCNAVRPGFTLTDSMKAVPEDSDIYRSYVDNTPMGGVAEPSDVAELVCFLLSDLSRWITGQIIGVDGGNGLRRGPDWSSIVLPEIGGLDVALAKEPGRRK